MTGIARKEAVMMVAGKRGMADPTSGPAADRKTQAQ